MFSYTQQQLQQITTEALAFAKKSGASAAEVSSSERIGQQVSVRMQQTDQIEYQQNKILDITVYDGKRKGYASTADFSKNAIEQTVKAALDIARYTEEDSYSGLADPDLLAKLPVPELSLYHSWNLSTEDALILAKNCEQAALDADTRIDNSEGAAVNTAQRQFVYANSNGFCAGYPSSFNSISCCVIAKDGEQMQRDYWFSQARDHNDLLAVEQIGQMAASRVLRRLHGKSLKTGQYPVIFEAPVAKSLVGHIVSALSGGQLYRQTTFLLDSLGKQKLAKPVRLTEHPHINKGIASCFFDDEGVATQERTVVGAGVVEGYFLGSYSARKLGMKTTANAGGAHNLKLEDTGHDLQQLLDLMGTGLLITELIGQGVNLLTGDYSRGAAGFWVENGQLMHPVEEITVAGNLSDMLMGIVGIGNDIQPNQPVINGSVFIDQMTVASNQ